MIESGDLQELGISTGHVHRLVCRGQLGVFRRDFQVLRGHSPTRSFRFHARSGELSEVMAPHFAGLRRIAKAALIAK